ncbi:MAG: DUF393 domain-containing protein [Pseudomonadota bacterium]
MSNDTHVMYNGECPICSREIDAYRRYAEARALPIRFEDLNGASTQLAEWGLTAEDAARRIHVVKDGALLSGVPAFAALWLDMPRFRRLGQFVMLPVIRPMVSVLYDHVLAPLLYGMHKRRHRLAKAKAQR